MSYILSTLLESNLSHSYQANNDIRNKIAQPEDYREGDLVHLGPARMTTKDFAGGLGKWLTG